MLFQRLEDLRVDHDLTQQDVADVLGCNREVYRRYEKGIRTIPIDLGQTPGSLGGVCAFRPT